MRPRAALLWVALAVACGGEPEGRGAPVEGPGAPALQPGSGRHPQLLAAGQPPISVDVPAPPSYRLVIDAPGEYQIDAQGEPRNADLFVYRGDELVASDHEPGDAQLVEFFERGAYSVRVVEHRARPMTAQLSAQRLRPLTPEGSITLGEPFVVTIAPFPFRARPRHDRAAARAVLLEVERPATVRCDASTRGQQRGRRDPVMAVIDADGRLLARDDDGGEGHDARIRRALEPGTYVVRVWDWMRRDGTFHLLCVAAE